METVCQKRPIEKVEKVQTKKRKKKIDTIKDLIEYTDNYLERDKKMLAEETREEIEYYKFCNGIESDEETPSQKEDIDFIVQEAYNDHYFPPDLLKLLNIREALTKLDKLVGMKSIKAQIINMVLYYIQDFHKNNENNENGENNDYLHTVITGGPGAGKTTIAAIIGEIYAGLGMLGYNQFKKLCRSDLVGKYLGHTAKKTKDALEICIGGVAFLDEAYSMAPRDSDRDSFSKEAIDTINEFLSEHKNDFAMIIAGYKDELDSTFFAMNPGLKRRFPWVFHIDDYSGEELLEIFKRKVDEIKWKLESNSIDKSFFEKNKSYFKFFGGDLETFLTKCKFAHVKRVFTETNAEKRVFTKEDINTGFESHKTHYGSKETDKFTSPPAFMYN